MSEHFTIMIDIPNSNAAAADLILSGIYGYLDDQGREELPFTGNLNSYVVRGKRVTERDVEESLAIGEEADLFYDEGNPNPLPDDFPTLD